MLLTFIPVRDRCRGRDESAVDVLKSVDPLVLIHGVLSPPSNRNGLLDRTSESVAPSVYDSRIIPINYGWLTHGQ